MEYNLEKGKKYFLKYVDFVTNKTKKTRKAWTFNYKQQGGLLNAVYYVFSTENTQMAIPDYLLREVNKSE